MIPRDPADTRADDPAPVDSLERSAPLESDSLLRTVAAAPSHSIPEPLALRLEPGTVVDGAYRIESEIGAGAMGVVYAATDLVLDRKVALKLHAIVGDDVRSSRMWREAKAMAKLAHPNVITVHEVGTFEGRVYIAMELVVGVNAADWIANVRPWREVLEVFVAAGRGLAAAHRVGLVHRDFKPSNVLIGEDGRVRVADFGLARALGDAVDRDVTTTSGLDSGSLALDERVTRTGAAVGTPAYMAPEQHEGLADARSDQYAFCVAMFEALWGLRPFAGSTVGELVRAAVDGRIRSVPDERGVPAWLRAVIVRGLSVRPGDRFADMDAVVRALQSDPSRARRRIAATIVGTAVVTGLVVAVARLATRDRDAIDCDDHQALLGEAWDPSDRAAVRDAMLGSGVSYAADTWTRVEPAIDAWSEAWAQVAADACAGRSLPPTEALRTAQGLCLEHRRRALASLVDVLAAGGPRSVERAVTAVSALPRPDDCSDVTDLAAAIAPPAEPGLRDAVESVRDRLGRAAALEQAGSLVEGRALADAAVTTARELGYGPLLAEAELRAGMLADAMGEQEPATVLLREAWSEALAAGDDGVAADAAIRLTSVIGQKLARPEDGLEWAWHARAEVRRLGGDARREATLIVGTGLIEEFRGDFEAAEAAYAGALAIRERIDGPEHVEVARILNNLGGVLRMRGKYPAALELLRRSLAIRERVLGPDHPAVASSLSAIASARLMQGDVDGAVTDQLRVLEIRERALGPEHPEVAGALMNLGIYHERRGEYDASLAVLERAKAIDLRVRGPDHPDVANTIENIGRVHFARGEYEAALGEYREALRIRELALGPEHPHVGFSLSNIGLALEELERHDESMAAYRRGLAIVEARMGPDHPDVADALEKVGNAEAWIGHHDEAIALHRRALAIREAAFGPHHGDVALSLMNVANSLEAQGAYDDALVLEHRAVTICEGPAGDEDGRLALALYNLGQTETLAKTGDAVATLERSLALYQARETPPAVVADVRFALAKAVMAAGDRARALALAGQARDGYASVPSAATLHGEVEAWMVSSGRGPARVHDRRPSP